MEYHQHFACDQNSYAVRSNVADRYKKYDHPLCISFVLCINVFHCCLEQQRVNISGHVGWKPFNFKYCPLNYGQRYLDALYLPRIVDEWLVKPLVIEGKPRRLRILDEYALMIMVF